MSGTGAVPDELIKTYRRKPYHKARSRASSYGPGKVHVMMLNKPTQTWWMQCSEKSNPYAGNPTPVAWDTEVDCKLCIRHGIPGEPREETWL